MTNALVYEKFVDTYSKDFNRCKNFEAGNGCIQDPHVNEAFAKTSKAQKLDVGRQLDLTLKNQKHFADVDVSNYKKFFD